jgi:hypothetical protein
MIVSPCHGADATRSQASERMGTHLQVSQNPMSLNVNGVGIVPSDMVHLDEIDVMLSGEFQPPESRGFAIPMVDTDACRVAGAPL